MQLMSNVKPLWTMAELCIPEDYPLFELVAQELTQICIGSNGVRLNFYQRVQDESGPSQWRPGASIDIESGFELHHAGGPVKAASNENLGSLAGCLTVLLSQCISSVERLPENELALVFSNGARLRLLTDPIGFESYHLHINGDSVGVTVTR